MTHTYVLVPQVYGSLTELPPATFTYSTAADSADTTVRAATGVTDVFACLGVGLCPRAFVESGGSFVDCMRLDCLHCGERHAVHLLLGGLEQAAQLGTFSPTSHQTPFLFLSARKFAHTWPRSAGTCSATG